MDEAFIAELKAKLGEEGYAKLLANIRAREKIVYMRAYEANGWAALFRGAAKSWQAWIGTLMTAWPLVSDQVTPLIEQTFGPVPSARFVSMVGILLIILRVKTNESLESKGAK